MAGREHPANKPAQNQPSPGRHSPNKPRTTPFIPENYGVHVDQTTNGGTSPLSSCSPYFGWARPGWGPFRRVRLSRPRCRLCNLLVDAALTLRLAVPSLPVLACGQALAIEEPGVVATPARGRPLKRESTEAGYRAPAAPPSPSSTTSGMTTGDEGVGAHDASHSNVPRVNGTSASNSGAPLLNTTTIWQVPTLSSEMEILPESKEAFEQAPVAATDLTSLTRSAGTVTSNAALGQWQTIGVLPLELHAVIMSKGTPAKALNSFMTRTLAPLSAKSFLYGPCSARTCSTVNPRLLRGGARLAMP